MRSKVDICNKCGWETVKSGATDKLRLHCPDCEPFEVNKEEASKIEKILERTCMCHHLLGIETEICGCKLIIDLKNYKG